jgi:hypothetical protein
MALATERRRCEQAEGLRILKWNGNDLEEPASAPQSWSIVRKP